MSDKSQKRSGFGIGELGQVPASTPEDEIEAERLCPSVSANAEYGTCQRCGVRIPRILLMSASRGTVCPDCYDEWSE